MKLILCLECTDVVRLVVGKGRRCECGKSSGRYLDRLNALIDGPCVPLGISNSSLAKALRIRPLPNGFGPRFEAFVIPPDAGSVCHTNPPRERMEAMQKDESARAISMALALAAEEDNWQ